MADEIREHERIPRRPAPEFTEVGSFGEALRTHGLFGTAVDDRNQYGPVGMMVQRRSRALAMVICWEVG